MPSPSYVLKYLNEDFYVTEVPLMPPRTTRKPYQYTYFWLRKSGHTTFAIVDRLKTFFGLGYEDIGNQGLKDEDAITEQLLSIKKVLSSRDIVAFNTRHAGKETYAVITHVTGYGLQPVKERMLHGNAFRIVVRNISPSFIQRVNDYVTTHRHHYFVNYYDSQRFGMPGGPYTTHHIGKAIVDDDWRAAYFGAKKTKNSLPRLVKRAGKPNYKATFQKMNPKTVNFFVSAYTSALWNAEVSELLRQHGSTTVQYFANVGRFHVPTDPAAPCPLIGTAPGFGFARETFTIFPRMNARNIVVGTTIYVEDVADDEHHRGKKKCTLSFFLPTGSYATMCIRQLLSRVAASE